MEKENRKIIEEFIICPGILDKNTRQYIVDRITSRFQENTKNLTHTEEYYNSRYVNQVVWADSIVEYLLQGIEDRKLCNENNELLDQVIVFFIQWIENKYKETERINPFAEDEQIINDILAGKTSKDLTLSQVESIIHRIAQLYHNIDLARFYREKIAEIRHSNDTHAHNGFKADLTTALRDLVITGKTEWIMKEIGKDINDFKSDARSKFSILNGVINHLGSMYSFLLPEYWNDKQIQKEAERRRKYHGGFDPGGHHGNWKNSLNFNQIATYGRLLQRDKDLQKLAEMLGKYRESESEVINETIQKMSVKYERRINPINKSEITGIHYSNDVSNMLPNEVLLLSDPDTEVLFAKNYAENKLLTWKYISHDMVAIPDPFNETIQKNVSINKEKQGPIIICVDTSGSMTGDPERIAKTITFAVTSIALKEKRYCYLIAFSTGIMTLELSSMASSSKNLIDFLTMGFGGGTDMNPAFYHTMKMLGTQNYKRADVLIISDFGIPPLTDEVLNQMKHHQKVNRTKFHALNIGATNYSFKMGGFDNEWVYDPVKQGIRVLAGQLQGLKKS